MVNKLVIIVFIFAAFVLVAGCSSVTNPTQSATGGQRTMTYYGSGMDPNIKSGDIITVVGLTDSSVIHTYQDSLSTGYKSFGDYGDVIVYNSPNGSTPIVHRAMYWVDQGQPMWTGGPAAPHGGYITKGDNNPIYDQQSAICSGQPVINAWITGIVQSPGGSQPSAPTSSPTPTVTVGPSPSQEPSPTPAQSNSTSASIGPIVGAWHGLIHNGPPYGDIIADISINGDGTYSATASYNIAGSGVITPTGDGRYTNVAPSGLTMILVLVDNDTLSIEYDNSTIGTLTRVT